MSKKHKGGPGRVPAGNRPQSGAASMTNDEEVPAGVPKDGQVPAQEEDPKRRLGDFTGTGEHSIQ